MAEITVYVCGSPTLFAGWLVRRSLVATNRTLVPWPWINFVDPVSWRNIQWLLPFVNFLVHCTTILSYRMQQSLHYCKHTSKETWLLTIAHILHCILAAECPVPCCHCLLIKVKIEAIYTSVHLRTEFHHISLPVLLHLTDELKQWTTPKTNARKLAFNTERFPYKL